MDDISRSYAAFVGDRCLGMGGLAIVLAAAKTWIENGGNGAILMFEDQTGRQVDFDLRGSLDQVVIRALAPKPASPGRPKLGVQSREVSLLPRHWEWLQSHPKGASAVLRSLIEEKLTSDAPRYRAEASRDAASRFMTAMAGNLGGYEEVSRCLYRKDQSGFRAGIEGWPEDIGNYAGRLAEPWFEYQVP